MLHDVKTLPNTPISPFVLPKQSLYNKVKKDNKLKGHDQLREGTGPSFKANTVLDEH